MTAQALLERVMESPSDLAPIAEKVFKGERLSFEDGLSLYLSHDLLSIGVMANYVREQKNGKKTYFINNYHINPTNICTGTCNFCAFAKKKNHPSAYFMELEEVVQRSLKAKELGASEIHMVSGLHPWQDLKFYEEVLKRIKAENPTIHMQAFTAVEIDYLAKQANLSIEETLTRLKAAGLDSLPGGGAEVFAPRIRQMLCPEKISGGRWLEVHGAAHKLGLKSNCTMLYGHFETEEEKVDHLVRLRTLQDETGGFMTYIPLAFHPENTKMDEFYPTTGFDDLKNLAIGRLMLDNIPHVKAFWIQIGEKIAQVSLSFGCDDLDGTVVEERITHAAGAKTQQFFGVDRILHTIRKAGYIPVERDTVYNVLKEY